METLYSSFKLICSGDTVLLGISTLVFLAALANETQWRVLSGFRFCGICTMLLSITFLLFTALELIQGERRKRTIAAAALFLAATALCFMGMHIVIETGN